jgi:penicillin-binding protein-related factor A (putative recombinase)
MIAVTRIPDGCKQLSGGKIIRVTTPFDFVVTYKSKSAFVDTKTIDGECFHYSSIKEHQVSEMILHENYGAIAGYVIWFRQIDVIIFVPAHILLENIKSKTSARISQSGVIVLGTHLNADMRLIFDRIS